MTEASTAPPLDVTVLESLFGDDMDIRASILDEFCTTTESYLREFAAAQDLVAIGAVAHKLKSSARTVGANVLGDICGDLEVACRGGQQLQVNQLLQLLEPAIHNVTRFVAEQARPS